MKGLTQSYLLHRIKQKTTTRLHKTVHYINVSILQLAKKQNRLGVNVTCHQLMMGYPKFDHSTPRGVTVKGVLTSGRRLHTF